MRPHPQAHPDSCQEIGSDSQTGRLIDALCLISEACHASYYQGRSRFPSFPLGLGFLACLSFSVVSPAFVSAWRNNPTSFSESISIRLASLSSRHHSPTAIAHQLEINYLSLQSQSGQFIDRSNSHCQDRF